MLKFACKICENMSEKMYALNPSSGYTTSANQSLVERGLGWRAARRLLARTASGRRDSLAFQHDRLENTRLGAASSAVSTEVKCIR